MSSAIVSYLRALDGNQGQWLICLGVSWTPLINSLKKGVSYDREETVASRQHLTLTVMLARHVVYGVAKSISA